MSLEILEEASDYCAKLAAVTQAHIIGDEEVVDILLTDIDPIEVRQCANVLRTLALSLRGASSGAGAYDAPTASSPSPRAATSAPNPLIRDRGLYSVRV